jgi:hypothetical protein
MCRCLCNQRRALASMCVCVWVMMGDIATAARIKIINSLRASELAREEMRSDHKKHFAFQFTPACSLSLWGYRLSFTPQEAIFHRLWCSRALFFCSASCYRGISFNQLHPMLAAVMACDCHSKQIHRDVVETKGGGRQEIGKNVQCLSIRGFLLMMSFKVLQNGDFDRYLFF